MNNNDGKSYYGIRLDNSELKNDAAQSRDILHNIGKAAEAEGDRIDKAFNRIGRTLVGVFSIQQAKIFAQQVVNVRGEIQSLEKSFEILAGKEYGRKLFAEIRDFAVKTPMAMGDLAKGAQTLLSFNVAAQEVMSILRAIGDISMGDAQKFNSLTLAFSQMSSTGKLMGQDLLQMINAGFNPLAVISEQTGKSIGTLKKEMEDGSISAEMIKKAFMDATSEGGKFYGMLEQQSKGIEGAISNLDGAIEDMFNAIGKNSEGIILGSIQTATDLVNSYEKVGEVIAELIATYGVYKAALITINALKSISASLTAGWTAAELAHYNALLLVEKAQRLLNAIIMKNPYVLAAAAVAALAYGIYKLVTYQTDAEKAQERLNKTTSNMNKEIASERVQIDSLFAHLKEAKVGTDEYKAAKQAILNQYGDYLKGLSSEVQSLADVEAAYKAVTKAAQDAAKARAFEAATKDAADVYAQKEADAKDKIYKALKDKFDYKTGKDGIALAETYYWQLMGVLEGSAEMSEELKKIVSEFDKEHHIQGDPDTGIGAYSYTTNAISDAISEARKAKSVYNSETEEARRRFGDAPKQEGDEKQAVVEVVKNKKYWEDYRKEQQGLLDAMTDAQLKTEEAARIRKNIADAQKKIDAYSVSKGMAADTRETKDENAEAVRAADRQQKLDAYAENVAQAARQAELDIEQARIDGMKEGLEKELAQNELNYQRLVEANKQRQANMVRELQDARELEWENENPKAKEQGLTFDRSTVTAAGLSSEQQAMIKEYARIAEEIRVMANRESLEKMLSDVLTYEEQRKKITDDYAKRREQMYNYNDKGNHTGLKSGVSEGNVAELDRQEQEALKAVDEQFASREVQYQAWCDAIGVLTLQQLEDLLAKAQEELAALENNGENSTELATARAKVNKLSDTVKKQKATDELAPKKRTIKEWQDLYSTLNECAGAFDDIGEAVGGTAGEILKVAGQISTSALQMINGIVTLANSSGAAMAGTAAAASTAIQTVEKASVILAVISAALQIATAIANLFNDDEEKQEEIEHLQNRIDQLQWELDNRDIVLMNEEYGASLVRVRRAIYETRIELIKAAAATENWFVIWKAAFGQISKDEGALAKTVEALASQYEKMSYTSGKALGDNRYSDYYEQLKNISEQQILVQEQIDNEKDKKDTDWGQISEWERKIEELGAQAKALVDDMMEDIIGGSAEEISEELSDAFFEAFENGKNAAEAWGDKVKEITSDIVKKMLVQNMLEGEIGKVFDKYKAQWFKNGQFVGAEGVKDSMSNFMNDLFAIESTMEQVWAAIPDELKEFLTGDAEREGVSNGIATASQDSVDELNARATTIQSHTFSISENSKLLVANTSAILSSVIAIEAHTEAMNTRLESVERNVKAMRDNLDDFNTQGMKLKK